MYENIKSDLGQRILDETRNIVREEGIDAVSIRRVTKAVGISTMALYYYFPNREQLIAAMVDREFQMLAGQWQAYEANSLTDGLNWFIDYALRQPHMYRCLFLLPRPGARQYPADFLGGKSPTFNLLVAAIQEEMKSHPPQNVDTYELAFQITAMIQGYLELYLSGRIDLSEADFRTLVFRAVKRTYHGITQ